MEKETKNRKGESQNLIAVVRLSKVGLFLNKQPLMGAIKCVRQHIRMHVSVFNLFRDSPVTVLSASVIFHSGS